MMCTGNVCFCLQGSVLAMFISVAQGGVCWQCLFLSPREMCAGNIYFCLPGRCVLATFISVSQEDVCWQHLFLSPRKMCAGNIYFCLPGRCVLAMFISVSQEDACCHCLFYLSSSQRGICSHCLSLTSPVWYKSTSARETRMDLCVHCGVLSLQNEQRPRIKILVCVDLPVCPVILDHMAIHVPRIWPLHLLIDSPCLWIRFVRHAFPKNYDDYFELNCSPHPTETEITSLGKLINDIFWAVNRGLSPRNGIWNDLTDLDVWPGSSLL